MADVGGVNVAFLAYTCDTNAIPVTGFEYAASICAVDYLTGGTEIDLSLIHICAVCAAAHILLAVESTASM